MKPVLEALTADESIQLVDIVRQKDPDVSFSVMDVYHADNNITGC